MRNTTSIAVLGGGVSGLTLARTLRELGYSRVVVFEREAEVGGKSCTVEVDGRPHDLGATMGVPIDYKHVLASSREANISTIRFPTEQHYDLARGQAVPLNRWRELPKVLAEAAKYLALHAKSWRGTKGYQLHEADPALHAPWRELVERHGLAAVNQRTLCYRTGYGYGFDDEVPAVLYTNLLRPQTLLGLSVSDPFMWRGGTQPIWKALAKTLDVRTSTMVTKIARPGDGEIIHSRGAVDRRGAHTRIEKFDRVVLTFNPKDALGLLDATHAERGWFSQVCTYPYATVACEVEGLTPGRSSVGYIDENMRRDRAGHPMAWVKRYADQNIYVVHLFAPAALSDAELAARIGGDLARLGGRLVSVRAVKRWQFFPHFGSDFMRAGGLSEIDRWQGQSRTYLIGEVLSFATMARVAELAVGFAHRMAREPAGITVAASRFAS